MRLVLGCWAVDVVWIVNTGDGWKLALGGGRGSRVIKDGLSREDCWCCEVEVVVEMMGMERVCY